MQKITLIVATAVIVSLSWLGLAAADTAAPADMTGSWAWKLQPQGGDAIDMSAQFKQDKDKFTGTFLDGFDQQKFDIKDGKVADGKVTFTVTRPVNDQTITVSYSGKLDGDTIKGTVEVKFGDQDPMTMPWEANRVKEAATQPAK